MPLDSQGFFTYDSSTPVRTLEDYSNLYAIPTNRKIRALEEKTSRFNYDLGDNTADLKASIFQLKQQINALETSLDATDLQDEIDQLRSAGNAVDAELESALQSFQDLNDKYAELQAAFKELAGRVDSLNQDDVEYTGWQQLTISRGLDIKKEEGLYRLVGNQLFLYITVLFNNPGSFSQIYRLPVQVANRLGDRPHFGANFADGKSFVVVFPNGVIQLTESPTEVYSEFSFIIN